MYKRVNRLEVGNFGILQRKRIWLTGHTVGPAPKDTAVPKQAHRQEYIAICDRNAIKGEFWTGKISYFFGHTPARLEVTSRCVIRIVLLVTNLNNLHSREHMTRRS